MGKTRRGEGQLEAFDHNADRYPAISEVLKRVVVAEDFPNGDIERLEVTCLANGEATWRVWTARAEEPVGGVFTDT